MTLIQREVAARHEVDQQKATEILARTIYRELREYGYEPRQIVSLSTELIGLVTDDMPAAPPR
jgi:hypothetical protein